MNKNKSEMNTEVRPRYTNSRLEKCKTMYSKFNNVLSSMEKWAHEISLKFDHWIYLFNFLCH